MKLLDLTLDDPIANVALDEALLEAAESGESCDQVLRLWEPADSLVVLGRSSPIATEVNVEFCQQHSIPIVRRCSGGATIATGPGCLMYALLFSYQRRPELRSLSTIHAMVMSTIGDAIADKGVATVLAGTCDLTIAGRKVSGNALRCKRNWVVYHGTLISRDFDLTIVEATLKMPQRRPDYREDRTHAEFLTRIPVSSRSLKRSLQNVWDADEVLDRWPEKRTWDLVSMKYSQSTWTHKV